MAKYQPPETRVHFGSRGINGQRCYQCCQRGRLETLNDVTAVLSDIMNLNAPSSFNEDDYLVMLRPYEPWTEPAPVTDGEEQKLALLAPGWPVIKPPRPTIRVLPKRIAVTVTGAVLLLAVEQIAEAIGQLAWQRSLNLASIAIQTAVDRTDIRGRMTCRECVKQNLWNQDNPIVKMDPPPGRYRQSPRRS